MSNPSPQTWLLLGHKAGDNNQILALAEALGWPGQEKHLSYRSTELLSNRLLGPTLLGLRRPQCSPLEPPWPDLILTAGRRNEPVARWIQQQSGGHSRIVHLGRPWAALEYFDLVITTPQYQLPRRENILFNELPLHRATPERLQEAARSWQPRLQELPRPWITVLAGGNSGPYVFDAQQATELGRRATAMAQAMGGTLLISSSARTSHTAWEALLRTIDAPHHAYHWRPKDADNPYFGYLALADRFIVTGESMSMLTEACMTGKPVYLFELPAGGSQLRDRLRFKVISHQLGQHLAPQRLRRDIQVMQKYLIEHGRVRSLNTDEAGEFPPPPPPQDLPRAVQRVRALFAPSTGRQG